MPSINTSASRTSSARINVLEVVGNAIVGGMEMCVMRLCAGLPRDRFNVVVACPFDGRFADHLRSLGLEVVIVQMPDEPSWVSIQTVAALVKLHRIDVMHAHLSNAHMLAGLVGKLTQTPVVATIHGRSVPTLDLEVQRLADTHLSLVCHPTFFHAIGLGVEQSRLHTIPNGVDTTVFTPDARLSNGRARGDGPLRRQFGIAADASVVGFVGRLSPEKAPEVFLRAALGVFRAQPDAHFVIVGDGPLRESCGQFVAQFGMQGRVHFCGMQHDMPSVYSELDIVVSTSHAEAMPLGLMEAMASGIPVVATKVGGVPDLIAQGVSGWLVGDNDFEGFAWHLNNLLSDVSVRCDMGRAGRQRVVEQFSLAESVAKTGALFESLSRPRTELRSVAQLTPSRNPRFVAPAKPPATINIAHPT